MPDVDIGKWIQTSEDPRTQSFREAIHLIITAFASQQELARMSFMKGGILLAVRYGSQRFTRDIDFSSPVAFSEEAAARVKDQLTAGLAFAQDRYNYATACRLQSSKAEPKPGPGPGKNWINYKMRVGYAAVGAPAHRRMLQGNPSSSVVEIDYSFLENAPTHEDLTIDSNFNIRVYGIATVIAEKFRALLQQTPRNRFRRQDIFDLNFLIQDRHWSLNSRQEILEILRSKAGDRNISVSPMSFQDSQLYCRAAARYPELAIELPVGALPDFDSTFERVKSFYEELPW